MATINPNINSASLNVQLTPTPAGAAAAQQAALVATTNFGAVSAGIDQSQTMLAALVQLQASWLGIGGGQPIGDGSTASLGAALSGQYALLTRGAPGNAQDLNSLQANLRGQYAGLLPGMTDDLTRIAPPLSSAYAQMMASGGLGVPAIPGMPMARPIQFGEVSTPESVMRSMPKTPPPPTPPKAT